VGYVGPRTGRFAKNHTSCTSNPSETDRIVRREFATGRIGGGTPYPPLVDFVVSPLGLIPKATAGKFRLIHDLSFPLGAGINHHIDPAVRSAVYEPFERALELILDTLAQHAQCFMIKTDVAEAFRLIPVAIEDQHLLGFFWNGLYYYDRRLPFGCASSPGTFLLVADALQSIICDTVPPGVPANMTHYADDFLGVASTKKQAAGLLLHVKATASALGVPMCDEKEERPCQRLEYLGITIDTVACTLTLHADKVATTCALLLKALSKPYIERKLLERVVGKLNFAVRVFPIGRPLLQSLFTLMGRLHQSRSRARLTAMVRADLELWYELLGQGTKHAAIIDPRPEPACDTLDWHTDASGSYGYGAVLGSEWISEPWNDELAHWSISAKELYAVVVAACTWRAKLSGRYVVIHCDNSATVACINSMSAHNLTMRILIRELFLMAAQAGFRLRAEHIAGEKNIEADWLSRNRLDLFEAHCVQRDKKATRVQTLVPTTWSATKTPTENAFSNTLTH
jgi:hypothetical protein